MKITLDPEQKRLGSTITGCVKNGQDLRAEIERLNKKAYEECQNHINNAIDNVLNGAKYERLDDKGNIYTLTNVLKKLECKKAEEQAL